MIIHLKDPGAFDPATQCCRCGKTVKVFAYKRNVGDLEDSLLEYLEVPGPGTYGFCSIKCFLIQDSLLEYIREIKKTTKWRKL